MKNYEENGYCFQRLLANYKEHGKLIIAFDFDNTIYDYHKEGLNLKRAKEAIISAYKLGHEVYCFTANNNTKFVNEYCKLVLGFEPAINECSLDKAFNNRKPYYSLLLDDRAGLSSALNLLVQFNEYFSNEKDTSDNNCDVIHNYMDNITST